LQFLALYLILLRLDPLEARSEKVHHWESVRSVLRTTLGFAARVEMSEWSDRARATIEAHAGPLSQCDWSGNQVGRKAVEGKCKYEPIVSPRTRLHVHPPSVVLANLSVADSDVNLMDDIVIKAIQATNMYVRVNFVPSPQLEVPALALQRP